MQKTFSPVFSCIIHNLIVPLQHEKEVFNFFTIVKGLEPQNIANIPQPSLDKLYTRSIQTLYQLYSKS